MTSQIKTGWVPLSSGDLDDRTGMQLRHLVSAVLQAANSAKVIKPTAATADLGAGRWVDTESGRAIRVGLQGLWLSRRPAARYGL